MTEWTIVIPLKVLSRAKSRLASLGERARTDLAEAIAHDTVHAARHAPGVTRVIVVGRQVEQRGLECVPEPIIGGLTAAIRAGIELARVSGPVSTAVLLGDLPALTSAHLSAALQCAGLYPRAFVPDASGAGTTMATARAGFSFAPEFGTHSAARHRAAGFTDLFAAHPAAIATALRTDADTVADLSAARRLGTSPHTARALRRLAEQTSDDRELAHR
ncbi:2-phospho-L-lactate guanylyltransferase [Microbacterium lacus]|uniref:2-phospho-L-lactate guanylyltransferase n=1 Tax=Microbacterium lacus TaxID=415217 RepID=UPI003851106F